MLSITSKQCILSFISIGFILCISCNNLSDSDRRTIVDSSKIVADSFKKKDLTGYLDMLWVKASEFKELNTQKVVFSFAFRSNGILTLYGWNAKGFLCVGGYDNKKEPDIKLNVGRPTYERLLPDVLFGNIILVEKAVKRINKQIGDTYQYVVFVPHNVDGFINYEIFLSNDDPGLTNLNANFTLVETDEFANPTPPKNYNE